MSEYNVFIDAVIEADNDEDAIAVGRRLRGRVFEHPNVHAADAQVEYPNGSQIPISQPKDAE